jgi:hypothetical protein
MSKRIYFDLKSILAIALFLLLYGYVCGNMFAGNLEKNSSNSVIFPLAIFALSLVGVGFNVVTRNKIINTNSLLVLLVLVFTLINLNQSPVSTTRRYIELLIPATFSIFIFKFCSNLYKIELIEKLAFFLLVAVFVFFIISYQHFSNELVLNLEKASSFNTYSCLYLLPLVLCNRNTLFRIGGLLLVFVSVLLSLKRGGIICFSLALVTFFLYEYYRRNKLFNIKIILLIILVIWFGLFILNKYGISENLTVRFSALEDLQSLSRSYIYSTLWAEIQQFDFVSILFGRGWNAVITHTKIGFSAHNDFLEFLYDYGIITFIVLVSLVIQLMRLTYLEIRRLSPFAGPLLAMLIILLVNSNISHIFFYDYNYVLFSITWALIISKIRLSNISNKL